MDAAEADHFEMLKNKVGNCLYISTRYFEGTGAVHAMVLADARLINLGYRNMEWLQLGRFGQLCRRWVLTDARLINVSYGNAL